jgi:hypothetical protein
MSWRWSGWRAGRLLYDWEELTGSTGSSSTVFVDAQPITKMKNTTIHPNSVAEGKLLAAFIRPQFALCGLKRSRRTIAPKEIPSRARLNDLNGYDFRRVFLPLRELGLIKGCCFDVLGVGIIFDLELNIRAAGDFDPNMDSSHAPLLRR